MPQRKVPKKQIADRMLSVRSKLKDLLFDLECNNEAYDLADIDSIEKLIENLLTASYKLNGQ